MTKEEEQEEKKKKLACEIKKLEIKFADDNGTCDSKMRYADFKNEAGYYLKSNDYNYDKALEAYQYDFEIDK